MAEVIEKNSIKIGKEPVVIFPLREWKKIEETLEDLEDAVRFNRAFEESRGEKLISLEEIRKKYKLK
ncbi:hypothetical protein COY61_00205 [bacterium (Candidatus Gribaldobacteria) CG_4_10_14_0_8_um_filter_33_9]|uniref:Prevent-host-death protein n=1 Tax=bacterium (Candidatus Gribaldobacteria) CG_4_10_14_0_8_um_filter_33_9 TaxID=2014266 RepID=A0A2M7RPY4_9BACT|nr:MAG: hypothetical protein COY61_00205 [bacterium (Candidatus Gribaldobacteria) CG_4_10_14_0_8_um_filter_33_9]